MKNNLVFQVHSSHKKIKYVSIDLCREVSNFLGDPRIVVVSSTKVKLSSVFKTLKSWKGNFVIPNDLRPEAFQIKGFFSVMYHLKVSITGFLHPLVCWYIMIGYWYMINGVLYWYTMDSLLAQKMVVYCTAGT